MNQVQNDEVADFEVFTSSSDLKNYHSWRHQFLVEKFSRSAKEVGMICPCCGSISKKENHLYTCSNCFHIFRKERDNLEFQKRFHLVSTRSDDEVKDEKIDWNIFHANRQNIVKNRLKKIDHILNPSFTCLDIGAGGGTFANVLKERVKEIECLEIVDFLSQEIMKHGFRTYTNDFLEQDFDQKYDIVFAWHVLEHVDDIDKFIAKCDALCRRYLVIEIPIGRPMPEQYDGHMHMFTEKSLETFLAQRFEKFILSEGVQNPALFSIIEKSI